MANSFYSLDKFGAGLLFLLLNTYIGAATATSVFFYSVDSNTDQLIHIDASTGTATVIGDLGQDARDIDLARTPDGRLWGLNSIFQSSVHLWEISPDTGAVISSVSVVGPTGSPITSAEGLGNDGNQLVIGYSSNGDANSNIFANLSEAGAITGPATLTIDMDGLSVGASTIPFYALDREPAVSSRLYELDPPSANLLGPGFDPSTFRFNDLMPAGQSIFASDNGDAVLHEFDLVSGAFQQTISLSLGTGYLGLASAGPLTPIPIPGGIWLILSGIIGLLGIAPKRNP